VLSSDDVVHRLYDDPEVVSAVVERFGDGVLDTSGAVNRDDLGAAAFAQPDGLAFLEGVLYPRIGRAREAWVAEQRARRPAAPLLVCEVPLLVEAGLQDRFDAVVVVTAPDEMRRRRVQERGQDFDERRARQAPEAEKVAAADMVFVNDGSLDDLDAWVDQVMARFATAGS
jgi:dephospho-CoA kinase